MAQNYILAFYLSELMWQLFLLLEFAKESQRSIRRKGPLMSWIEKILKKVT